MTSAYVRVWKLGPQKHYGHHFINKSLIKCCYGVMSSLHWTVSFITQAINPVKVWSSSILFNHNTSSKQAVKYCTHWHCMKYMHIYVTGPAKMAHKVDHIFQLCCMIYVRNLNEFSIINDEKFNKQHFTTYLHGVNVLYRTHKIFNVLWLGVICLGPFLLS